MILDKTLQCVQNKKSSYSFPAFNFEFCLSIFLRFNLAILPNLAVFLGELLGEPFGELDSFVS